MPYIIKTCDVCGKKYHVHKNGKVKGACEHIKIGRLRGKKVFLTTTDTKELDKMMDAEYGKSRKR